MEGMYSLQSEQHGSYLWLRREVGGYLGWGYNQENWDFEKLGKVDSIVQSGVMQFYYPPPLPQQNEHKPASVPRQWSFLTPLATLTLVTGKNAYDLPADFSGMLGEFTYSNGVTAQRITVVDETRLRRLYASDPRAGNPQYCAIRPKRSDGSVSQQYEVIFYPTPVDFVAVSTYSGDGFLELEDDDELQLESESHQSLVLEYRYSVTPSPLTVDRPWPLCGKQYAETLLQSCLAVAEERELKIQGAATAKWLERLAASIRLDSVAAGEDTGEIWPLGNPPDDLTVDLDYLERLIGSKLGFGAHSGSWGNTESEQVNEVVRTGLRRFYSPPVFPGEKYAHEWSFLRPLATMNLQADVYEYEFPKDYAMLDGPLTYSPGTSVLYQPIKLVSEHQVRAKRQSLEITGRPQIAALRPKAQVDGLGTRWELVFWPTPDASYSLQYRYRTNPGLLSSGVAEPAGGMPHAQTVVESCLWAADEMLGVTNSVHRVAYLECLGSSVSHDKLANAPETLGYNVDRSDSFGLFSGPYADYRDIQQSNTTTYAGQTY